MPKHVDSGAHAFALRVGHGGAQAVLFGVAHAALAALLRDVRSVRTSLAQRADRVGRVAPGPLGECAR
ncbi:MAG TPA: hypothetical protein DCQ06_08710 [Myxococcales bacterium]|nr:hypothetical protein [Myxococcales bacterium]HAN31662.1 hypothetical protein [Myxococcales bacterium]